MAFFDVAEFEATGTHPCPHIDRLLRKTDCGRAGRFWDYSGAFIEFCSSSFATDFFAAELKRVCVSPDYDHLSQSDEISVIETVCYKIKISQLHFDTSLQIEGGSEIACYANDFITYNLGPGTLTLDLFETSCAHDNDVFNISQKATRKGEIALRKGEHISVHAGKDILKIVGADDVVYQIHCVSTSAGPSMVWHYDALTLKPKYCTAGSTEASRMETVVGILVRMGGTVGMPSLQKLAGYKDHFVRWSAIKAVLALDKKIGVDLLRTATRDPHQHVRTAASVVLSKIKGEEEWR